MSLAKKPRTKQPQPKPKHRLPRGYDTAFADADWPQLTGELAGLLWRVVDNLGRLRDLLVIAEHAASLRAQGHDVHISIGGAPGSTTPARLTDSGSLADPTVIHLRRTLRNATRRLRHYAESLDVDLGYRDPPKGLRGPNGRLHILVSNPEVGPDDAIGEPISTTTIIRTADPSPQASTGDLDESTG